MKKFGKILAWIAGVIVVLLIVAVIALELFFPAERAKQLIVEQGTEALGRSITVDAVDVSVWGGLGVVLEDVTIANPPDWPGDDTMLVADQIDVKLKFWPLLSGEYRLDRLIIDRPIIGLRKTETGQDNYTFAATDTAAAAQELPEEARSAAVAVSFDRLEINDGRLTYVDDSAGTSVTLNEFDLSTSLANPRPNVFRSEGRLEVPELVAVTEDTMPAFALGLRYQAEYDLDRKNLLLEDSRVSVNDLNFAVSGELDHGGEALAARGRITSNEIAVRDLFSLLPPAQLAMLEDYNIQGDFSLEADVQYAGAQADPLDYSGTARISDMLLEYEQVEGALRIPAALVDFEKDNARLNITDASFAGEPLKGYVYVENFDAPVVNAELSGQIDLALVRPFLPAEDSPELAGDAAFAIKASGPVDNVEQLDISGEVDVTNGRYASAMLPEPVESFSLDLYFDKGVVRVNSLQATMPSGSLSFTGRINDLIPYLMADTLQPANVSPAIDGALEAHANLAMLQPFLPEEGDPEISGMLHTNLQLAGNILEPSGLRVRGSLEINEGAYRDTTLAEQIQHFDTRLTIVPDTIRIDEFNARFETSDLSLTGSLIQPFPYLLPLETVDKSQVPKPFLRFAMTSNRFNVDSLFPETSPSATIPGAGTVAADTVAPFILPDIDGRGTVSFDSVTYMDMNFTDLTGNVFIENRIVSITDVSGNVYSGDVTGETSIDFTNFEEPVYEGRFNAMNIQANEFAERFTKFGQFLYGSMNFEGTYEASGWESDAILTSLDMNSDALIREGRVEASGKVYYALQVVGNLINEQIDRTQQLRNLQTDVIVDSGRVRFDKLTAGLGDLGNLELSGYYTFDNEVNYTGTLALSEEYTSKVLSNGVLGGVSDFLGSGSSIKQLKLPVSIGGTIDNPAVNISVEDIAEQAGQGVLEGATDKLKNLLKKP